VNSACKNIVLCGFMATGKSSVGKKLAELTGYTFIDLDAAVESEEGLTVAEIFASQGEPAFRALESRMIERLADKSGIVVATGGGAVVNPKNLENLKKCGVVVTLTADIPVILQRAGSGDDRPLLQCADREERIRSLLRQREHAYAQADIILDTSGLTIDAVALRLLECLRGFGIDLTPVD